VLQGGKRGEPLEQLRAFYRYFDLPVGVDLLIYAEDQIAERLRQGDAFVTRAWEQSLRLTDSGVHPKKGNPLLERGRQVEGESDDGAG